MAMFFAKGNCRYLIKVSDRNEKVLLRLLEARLDHESLQYLVIVAFLSFDGIIKISDRLEYNKKEQNSFYAKTDCATMQQSYKGFLFIDFSLKCDSRHLNILPLCMNM